MSFLKMISSRKFKNNFKISFKAERVYALSVLLINPFLKCQATNAAYINKYSYLSNNDHIHALTALV
jgi:hypothetical protein